MYRTNMIYRYANGQTEESITLRFDCKQSELTAMENVRNKCIKNGEVYKKENIIKMITSHIDTKG